MNNLIKFSFFALVATFSLAACENKSTHESVENDLEEAADDTKAAVKEAGTEIKAGAKKAGAEIKEGAEKARTKIKEEVNEARN